VAKDGKSLICQVNIHSLARRFFIDITAQAYMGFKLKVHTHTHTHTHTYIYFASSFFEQ
jgi:hypothetical protein